MLILKKSAVAAAAVALAAVLLCCVGVSAVSFAGNVEEAIFSIVLDAGHGGVDPGVLGTETKIKESDINLKIVKELEKYFLDAGFRVTLTRKTEGGLYGLPTNGYKRRDMEKRKEIIENASPNIVISVHQNNFLADPSRRGGQVFFREGDASGAALAEEIQNRLNGLGEKQYSALRGDYYMLNCTHFPSVIVECGFLSNAEDEKLLSDKEYQQKVAYAIFCGALQYFS